MTGTPFEQFFAGKFRTMMENVGDVPGLLTGDSTLLEASWDRKAAYLLWTAMGNRVEPSIPDARQVDLEEVIAAAPVDDFDGLLG